MTFVPFVSVAVDPSFPFASTRLRLRGNAFDHVCNPLQPQLPQNGPFMGWLEVPDRDSY